MQLEPAILWLQKQAPSTVIQSCTEGRSKRDILNTLTPLFIAIMAQVSPLNLDGSIFIKVFDHCRRKPMHISLVRTLYMHGPFLKENILTMVILKQELLGSSILHTLFPSVLTLLVIFYGIMFGNHPGEKSSPIYLNSKEKSYLFEKRNQ